MDKCNYFVNSRVIHGVARKAEIILPECDLGEELIDSEENLEEKEVIEECHMCGEVTDWFCISCDKPVCESCTVTFTEHNHVTETRCRLCEEFYSQIE